MRGATRRQLGRDLERAAGRPVGDGHEARLGAVPRAPGQTPSTRIRLAHEQRRCDRGDSDQADARPDPDLALEDLHRDRCPGFGVVPDTAPPGLVAGDVPVPVSYTHLTLPTT